MRANGRPRKSARYCKRARAREREEPRVRRRRGCLPDSLRIAAEASLVLCLKSAKDEREYKRRPVGFRATVRPKTVLENCRR